MLELSDCNIGIPGIDYKDNELITWTKKSLVQKYDGKIFENILLDNYGDYSWEWNYEKPLKQPVAYEGIFFCNHLHGYGNLSYVDGSTFEGFFNKSHPYGPGIRTYTNGEQDIGYWMNNKLSRICVIFHNENIQKFHNSTSLLGLKHIIKLDNVNYLKNDKTNFFMSPEHKSYFFNNNLMQEKLTMCNCIDNNEINKNCLIGNNTKKYIKLLNFLFIYKDYINRRILKILLNKRDSFNPIGYLENKGRIFLDLCRNNEDTENTKQIIDFLYDNNNNDVDINLADTSGNFPLLMATSTDYHDLMEILLELNCDINLLNDNGINALNLAITRYIATRHKRLCWDHSFLKENYLHEDLKAKADEFSDVEFWNSFMAAPLGPNELLSQIKHGETSDTNTCEACDENYLFNNHEQYIKEILLARKKKKFVDIEDYEKINKIARTIKMLLSRSPNLIQSELPLPSITLVLYTNNPILILLLLKSLKLENLMLDKIIKEDFCRLLKCLEKVLFIRLDGGKIDDKEILDMISGSDKQNNLNVNKAKYDKNGKLRGDGDGNDSRLSNRRNKNKNKNKNKKFGYGDGRDGDDHGADGANDNFDGDDKNGNMGNKMKLENFCVLRDGNLYYKRKPYYDLNDYSLNY